MNITIQELMTGFFIPFFITIFLCLYVGFFALHAAQHVADPSDRSGWLVLIIGFNLFGATLYLVTKYRKFKAVGKGNLISAKKRNFSDFFKLSEEEKRSLPISV